MPRVTILSRDRLLQFPEPNRPQTVVAVTYQSGLLPPETVYLPDDNYIEAAPEASAPQIAIRLLPKDDAAQKAEDDAIRTDLAARQSFKPITRDI